MATVIAVAIAGCGASTPSASDSASLGSAASTTSPSASTASAASAGATSSTSAPPQARLTAALDAFADGYRFENTITVGSAIATHATGRRVGANAEFVVESAGTEVTYRVVGPTSWVQRPGAAWVVVDGTAANADPLGALRVPTTIEPGPATSSGGSSLVATYPAKALGLTGTDASTVTLAIATDGSLVAIFELKTTAGTATSTTTFQALTDTTAIVAPG